MANRDEIFGPSGFVISATETINLGDVCDGKVGRIELGVHDESSMNISIVPKGGPANAATFTKQNVGYVTALAPDTVINPGTTAITAVGNYLIEASGMAIDLVCTVSGGSARLYARRIVG